MHPLFPTQSGAYAWLMAAGVLASAIWWFAKSRHDSALLMVYIGALGGAFLGAKLAYIVAEVWFDWGREDFWMRLATGKSILGGLLGGYAGVEGMKRLAGHRHSTGDAFALILPVGLLLGRTGCLLHGCCLGRPVGDEFLLHLQDCAGVLRWPAVPVEMAFLTGMLVLTLVLHGSGKLRDRRFFVFLAAYGGFRFIHEWARDTPKWFSWLSGYQVIALAMALIGVAMFIRRGRTPISERADGR